MNDSESPISGDSKQIVTAQTLPSGGGLKSHNRTGLIISALVISLVIAGGVSVLLYSRHNNNKISVGTVRSNVCGKELLKEASLYLDSSKSKQLKKVVDKIQKLPDYQKDPNCLNVVVTYYTNINDNEQAKTNFELLKAVYDDKGFSSDLGSKARSMKDLSAYVDYIKTLETKKYNGNARLAPQP